MMNFLKATTIAMLLTATHADIQETADLTTDVDIQETADKTTTEQELDDLIAA
jgi:hypothetical protein